MGQITLAERPKRKYVKRAPLALVKNDPPTKPPETVDHSDLRLKCLELALLGSTQNLGADFVARRAEDFVQYVLNGPPAKAPPTLDDRLTQAFLDTGESLSSM